MYKCEKCDNVKEIKAKMGEAPKKLICDKCNGDMYRVFNATITIPYIFKNPPAFDYDKAPSSTYGIKKRFSVVDNPLKK